jgi:quercetin dioxygenase-like cupin family protein
MNRFIFGVDKDGRNKTLYEGPVIPVGINDEKLAATSEASGEGNYLAWAAREPRTSTEDYVSTIPDFNLKLKPGETRFVRNVIAPGAESPMHRTPHINDYLIALSGELTMFLEDGTSRKIRPGDMFVQLAGWHCWRNEGSEPFVMAGVIIGIETEEDVYYGVEIAGPHG